MIDSRIDNLGQRVDLGIRRGSTWALPLEIDADLTGATVECEVCGVAATVTYTDRPAGLCTVSLTDVQTRALEGPVSALGETTSGQWGVTLVDAQDARIPLLYGRVSVAGELNAP